MKHIKNISRILGLFVISLAMDLLSFIVVPIALIGLKETDNHLPKWARWWETYDNDINGDIYWHGAEHANGKQRTYWWRLKWLLRNMSGTFLYEVMGAKLKSDVYYVVEGDVYVADRPHGKSGFLYAEAHSDGKMWPCYLYVKQWGKTGRCLRLYLGWAFKFSRPLEGWERSERNVQYTFSVNPLMGFRE